LRNSFLYFCEREDEEQNGIKQIRTVEIISFVSHVSSDKYGKFLFFPSTN